MVLLARSLSVNNHYGLQPPIHVEFPTSYCLLAALTTLCLSFAT